MKRALIIRHVAHEGVAGYRAPIEAAGFVVERVAACETNWGMADLLSPELLVVMGGPMGVYQAAAHPWITPELAGIARRLRTGRATLGVCLGAQMMAAALGASVYPGPVREIGFAPVALTGAGEGSALRHLAGVPVLHWHGDTFNLPDGAARLASTSAYANQAFAIGGHALALQFHAEMGDDPRFDAWLAEDADYIRGAGVDADALRSDHDRLGSGAVRAGQAMLAEWLAGL